jgi:hypothetical protein
MEKRTIVLNDIKALCYTLIIKGGFIVNFIYLKRSCLYEVFIGFLFYFVGFLLTFLNNPYVL